MVASLSFWVRSTCLAVSTFEGETNPLVLSKIRIKIVNFDEILAMKMER